MAFLHFQLTSKKITDTDRGLKLKAVPTVWQNLLRVSTRDFILSLSSMAKITSGKYDYMSTSLIIIYRHQNDHFGYFSCVFSCFTKTFDEWLYCTLFKGLITCCIYVRIIYLPLGCSTYLFQEGRVFWNILRIRAQSVTNNLTISVKIQGASSTLFRYYILVSTWNVKMVTGMYSRVQYILYTWGYTYLQCIYTFYSTYLSAVNFSFYFTPT